MQRFSRTSLALVGLSMAAPLAASAGDIPSYAKGGFKTPSESSAPASATVGRDGKVVVANVPAGMPVAPAPRVMSEAEARSMAPPPRIVACAHSAHGVCPSCQAVLDMPGTVTMMPPAAAPAVAEAPGRAVASAPGHTHPLPGVPAAPGRALAQANGPEDGPMPIGVTQANYQQGGPVGMPAGAPMMVRPGAPGAPGHAVAGGEPRMGSAPYQAPNKELRPSILGHLFGWSYLGKDRRDARMRAEGQAHASIRYGDEGKGVNELPASMVYGPR